MKYKAYDKVRILPKEKLTEVLKNRKYFKNTEKLKWAGKVVTILSIEKFLNDEQYYQINEVSKNLAFTDDMIEGLKYENFSVKGSFTLLVAFKEVAEKIGWKFNKDIDNCHPFVENLHEKNIRFIFSVSKNTPYINIGYIGYFSDIQKVDFTLPEQFTDALIYAKESLEFIESEEKIFRFVKYVGNPLGTVDDWWNVGEIYKVRSVDKDYYYVTNYRECDNKFEKNRFVPATEKEYDEFVESIKKRTFGFGGRSWIIEGGTATSGIEKISLKEVSNVMNWIEAIPKTLKYNLTMEVSEQTIINVYSLFFKEKKFGFGCCVDTYDKAMEFYKRLKKSNLHNEV